ncbi:hypothetical protein HMPREF9946_03102 [Acetobacteraceae bacterium AT-5844]|nr:hypothetical protein HMPREF9946_03102 [Acetobacteraceae bacterium AT-5844]
MRPIEHRAREIMGACQPDAMADMLAKAEASMQAVAALFREQPADGDDAPHLREVIALRSTLALIQNATKGEQ